MRHEAPARLLKPFTAASVEPTSTYRPEIDGLRALAVSSVLLFHADLGPFTGGFVGVDVFFVISGFLITKIIHDELARDHFSLASFYERRIRRIMPPLLLMLLTVIIGGYWLLLPEQYLETAKSVFSTETFYSNFLFWRQTGYFAAAGGVTPLLHTWSLAVEEQFYLLFPLLMMALYRLAKERLKFVVSTLLIGSLLLASAAVFLAPSATFFLLPTRGWELLVGAWLAVGVVPVLDARWSWAREAEAAAGLLLILTAVFVYREGIYFPGLAALPPTIGAAMIIHANSASGTIVGKALSLRPVVYIGLISYALYLFHWPIFVFLRQYLLTPHLSPMAAMSGIAASGALAALSFHFVEKPFRNRAQMPRGAVYASAGVASMIVAAAAGVILLSSGLPERFTHESREFAAGARNFDAKSRRCLNMEVGAALVSKDCSMGEEGPHSFVLFGDSHAAAIVLAVDEAAKAAGKSGVLIARNTCPPGAGQRADWGGASIPDKRNCKARNASVIDYMARAPGVDTIILSAYWLAYERLTTETTDDVALAVESFVAGGKRVIILSGIPDFDIDVPSALAWQAQRRLPLGAPLKAHSARMDERLAEIARRESVRIVPLRSLFCDGAKCRSHVGGDALFTDNNHLSVYADQHVVAPYLIDAGILAQRRP